MPHSPTTTHRLQAAGATHAPIKTRSPASQNVSKRLLTDHEAGPDATDFIGSHLTLSPKQGKIPKNTASITFDWHIIKFVHSGTSRPDTV